MMLIKGPVPPLTEERIGLCGHGSLGAVLPGLFWESGGWPASVAMVVVVQVVTISIAMMFWKSRPEGLHYDYV